MSSEDYIDDDEGGVLEDLSSVDRQLFEGIAEADEAAVQQALLSSANVNAVDYRYDHDGVTPLWGACSRGFDETVRILLDAGANVRWKDRCGRSAILIACVRGHLAIVQQLLHRDSTLLEITNNAGGTPLFCAVSGGKLPVVRFLMEHGANIATTTSEGTTTLMKACRQGNLDVVRLLLAAGIDVEARDGMVRTALHYAAMANKIEVVRELILQHNANMVAVDGNGHTPFDAPRGGWYRSHALNDSLLEMYGRQLTVDHGHRALHAIFGAAEFSFIADHGFHPSSNPLRISLPLGRLQVEQWRTLFHSLDNTGQMIRTRDETGKLPIHIACRTTAPLEILAGIIELDPTTLHMADYTGALPLHDYCNGVVEFSCVKFLVEHGGVGTLSIRNREGALPLHILCGSINPPFQAVQYLIQSFPRSVSMRTNAGQFPFIMAATCEASTSASLSVVYELVRTNPSLVVPR